MPDPFRMQIDSRLEQGFTHRQKLHRGAGADPANGKMQQLKPFTHPASA